MTLVWTAPAECPDRARVLAKIDRLAPASARLRVRVDATVTRDERGYRVALVTEADGARGERSLEAATCASLADATAVIVAMMLDPANTPAGSSASAPIASVATSPAPAESTDGPPVPEMPAPARAIAGLLTAGGALDSGLGPGARVGVMVGGGVTIDRLRLDVLGSSFSGRTARVEATPDAGGDVTVRSLLARGCVTPSRAIVASYACVVGGAAQVSASGFGVAAPSSGSATFGVVGASGFTALHLTSSVSLELGAEALVPLARPRFVLEGVGEAHRVAPVTLGLRAGLGVAF